MKMKKYKSNPDFLMPEESLLWRKVLSQGIRDISDTNERVRKDALRWVLTPDFQTVCDFAFVDGESLKEQIANLAGMSVALARKYGNLLRAEIEQAP